MRAKPTSQQIGRDLEDRVEELLKVWGFPYRRAHPIETSFGARFTVDFWLPPLLGRPGVVVEAKNFGVAARRPGDSRGRKAQEALYLLTHMRRYCDQTRGARIVLVSGAESFSRPQVDFLTAELGPEVHVVSMEAPESLRSVLLPTPAGSGQTSPATQEARTMTQWPRTADREELEIAGFIAAYRRLPGSREFAVMAKGEMPDYIVRDVHTGQEYGVELTSVYMDDRSVPDLHMRDEKGPVPLPDNEEELERYRTRLVGAIIDKVCKARKGYDRTRPLILAICVNEYISMYLREAELKQLTVRYDGVFEAMTPFTEIVFWNLPNAGVFRATPSRATA